MNQGRVDITNPLVVISSLIGSGLVLGILLHQQALISVIPLSLIFVLLGTVGIVSLADIHRTANAWNYNVTPRTFEHLPKGTWDVAAISMNIGESGGYVYTTITERPLDSEFPARTAFSTLVLQPQFIDILDYRDINNGKKPLRISIGPKNISFAWPPKPHGLHNVLT